MSRIEIRGEQYPIQKVFSDDFAFTVPSYQRPYAWTTEHAGELIDDLLVFLGEGQEPVDELNPYARLGYHWQSLRREGSLPTSYHVSRYLASCRPRR